MSKKKIRNKSCKDIGVARANTLRRKAKKLAKRLRYYKKQPPTLLDNFNDELKSLVIKEIERWKANNGK